MSRTFGSLRVSLVFGPAGNSVDPDHATCLRYLAQHDVLDINMARAYGDGEELIGAGLAAVGPSVAGRFTVSTKVHPSTHASGTLSQQSVLAQARESLSLLGIDSVDYFLVHQPDTGGVPLEETLRAADELYRAGIFRRFGVSNFPAYGVMQVYYKCKELGYVLPSVYEGFYNCLLRQVEHEVLPCCRRLGMAFYCYSPLAAGLLGGNPRHSFASVMSGQAYSAGRSSDPKVLAEAAAHVEAACQRAGVEIRQAAFRWLFNHSGLAAGDGVITGARSLAELQSIVEPMCEESGPLPAEVVDAIDTAWQDIVGGHMVYPTRDLPDFARL